LNFRVKNYKFLIKDNNISDEGCFIICEILKNSKIEKINLKNTNITTIGLKCLKEALKNNISLIEINLDSNFVDFLKS
jgi:DNA-binding protein